MIGLELTGEMPERVKRIDWPPTATHPEIIDAEGRARQGLEPLDHEQVLAKLPAGALRNPSPPERRSGTSI